MTAVTVLSTRLAEDLHYRELDLKLARLRIARKEEKLERVRELWLRAIRVAAGSDPEDPGGAAP